MKNENSLKYRHELKFRISELEKAKIIARIADIVSLDTNAVNGQYMIRSLYFDDIWNSAYEEKMSGIASRRKYRIRVYNCSDGQIKLEKKSKQGNYICKEAANLSRDEAEKILAGDYVFLRRREEALCREFYAECMTSVMRPKVIVDYERVPYVYEAGTVRITFDMNVRAGMLSYDLFDKSLPAIGVLTPEELIMEVKYTEFLPQIIRNILPPEDSELTAASKYVLCYEKKYGIIS